MASPYPTKTEHEILQLLLPGREMYGLELVKASDGKLKRGTVYVLLDRLEEKGFVRSRPAEPSGRRVYTVTGLGRKVGRSIGSGLAGGRREVFA